MKRGIYLAICMVVALVISGLLLPEPEEITKDQGRQDELETLVNSVATSVDTNWQYYFVEPIQRLANGEDVETVKADLELLVDLLEGEKKKLAALEGDEKVEQMRDELTKAIDKRIEAVQALLAIEDRQEAANLDVESLIVESNEHLTRAVSAYKELSK